MKVAIHVGYPKAASSTLQKFLFDKHSDINFLGVYPTANNGQNLSEVNSGSKFLQSPLLKKIYHDLVYLEGIELNDELLDNYRDKIVSEMRSDKINVISSERFSWVRMSHCDRKIKADRLKYLFPKSKILIVIRRQEDILKSFYRAHPYGVNGKFTSIDKWLENEFNSRNITFARSLKYYEYISYYVKIFGLENVLVLPVEEMSADLKIFSEKLSQFFEISLSQTYSLLEGKRENIGSSYRAFGYRKVVSLIKHGIPFYNGSNDLLKKANKKLELILANGYKHNLELCSELEKYVYDYYKEDNARIADEYSLDLSKYNYF